MIHFSARQYLGLLVHEKMICEWWTGKWKETVMAQQLHDSSNSLKGLRTNTKIQFRILLPRYLQDTSHKHYRRSNLTDLHAHQQQRKHRWCHYSVSFVTKKVLKHSTTSKQKFICMWFITWCSLYQN
jgi:hypothetical protein